MKIKKQSFPQRLFSLYLIHILLFAVAIDIYADESDATSQENISVGNEVIKDSEIIKRLNELYQNTNSLNEIEIKVNAGIVTLSGSTATNEAHQEALSIARRIDGVISIQDDITVEYIVSERLNVVSTKLQEKLTYLYSNLPIFLVAILVFIFFWIFSSVITSWDLLYKKLTPNLFLQTISKQITRAFIIFIGFVIALEILDATAILTTILGAAGIFGLAVGFAIRDTVENYIASILLSLRQPFAPNDHIMLEGFEGKVVRLTSRETILISLDGNHVRIPNAAVYKGNIVNYTRSPKRRFNFEVGVDTSVTLDAVQNLAIETLSNTPGVSNDPPSRCLISKLGDSNVVLNLYGWVDQDYYDFSKVKSEAIRKIKEAFDAANFEMPEPIYRLKIENNSDSLSIEKQAPSKINISNKAVTSTNNHNKVTDIAKDTYIDEQIVEENSQDIEENLLTENNLN